MDPPAATASSTTLPTLVPSPRGSRTRLGEDDASETEEVQFAPIISHDNVSRQNTRRGSRSLSLHRIRRTTTTESRKEARDADLDVNLPYRTLTTEANMDEYRVESRTGEIPGPPKPGVGKGNYRLVTFEPGDPGNPKNWTKTRKWYCTLIVAFTCFVVAFESSVITADIIGVAREFDASYELTLASISLFVMGFGIGMSSELCALNFISPF